MSFTPALDFAFEIRAEVADTLHIGHGDGEVAEFTPITGGSVDGPRLRGKVLPGEATGAVRAGRCASWRPATCSRPRTAP